MVLLYTYLVFPAKYSVCKNVGLKTLYCRRLCIKLHYRQSSTEGSHYIYKRVQIKLFCIDF